MEVAPLCEVVPQMACFQRIIVSSDSISSNYICSLPEEAIGNCLKAVDLVICEVIFLAKSLNKE
jgi:hypothetical protein